RLMDGVTRESWVKVRAALLHEAEKAVTYHRRLCDVSQRAMKATKDNRSEALEAFRVAVDAAEKANRAVRIFQSVMDAEKPEQRSGPKASKRKSLPPIKAGEWRQAVYDRATPAMQPAIAALWAGARPAEVEKGVELERIFTSTGLASVIRIKGAKLTDHSGQEVRELVVQRGTQLGEALFLQAGDPGSPRHVTRRAARLNKDFAWLRSERKIPSKISPYSLRHAFCADLKADGTDPETIAKAMGHRSARSQNNYGSVRQGRGGLGVISISASQEVRTSWNRGPDKRNDSPGMS
ncbi:MAG: site-specific integrase, partial [Oceanicaulis sp.]|nr:site-specific integrase [Oceanicaulis sp.]